VTTIINQPEKNQKLNEDVGRSEKSEIAMLINYCRKLGTWSHKASHRLEGD
jgi:hypothetical protein